MKLFAPIIGGAGTGISTSVAETAVLNRKKIIKIKENELSDRILETVPENEGAHCSACGA